MNSVVFEVWGITQATIERPGTIVTYLTFADDLDISALIVETEYFFPFPKVAGFNIYVASPDGADVQLEVADVVNNLDALARSWLDAMADDDDELAIQLPARCGRCLSFSWLGSAPSGRVWGRCAKGGMSVSVNDLPGSGCFEPADDGPEWAMGGSS